MITRVLFPATKRRSFRKTRPGSPEVILRKTCTFYEKQGEGYPVPELLILANRAGFRWLASVFARCAQKAGESHPTPAGDPDDHEHIDLWHPEINPLHSDELAFRLGILTPKNRRAVFKKYGLRRRQSFQGDLVSQYQRQIAEVRPQWRRVLAFDRQWNRDLEREDRRWKPVVAKLRRRQKRELKQLTRSASAKPPLIRRLFRGVAEIKASPSTTGLTRDAFYVFARTRREAAGRFEESLKSAGYEVTVMPEAEPIPCNQPIEMPVGAIRPADLLRAWDTGEVLSGWFQMPAA
jgi:hypothetical protein